LSSEWRRTGGLSRRLVRVLPDLEADDVKIVTIGFWSLVSGASSTSWSRSSRSDVERRSRQRIT
jgi:hypothetical protein